MDKSEIKRENFNHNFLMTGIIRLDYSGVIEIEDTVKVLSKDLYDAGFTSVNEGYISDFSIKLADPVRIETIRSIPVEEFTKNRSYKFTNPVNKNEIEITKFFTILKIDYSTYLKFENHVSVFAIIIKNLKSENRLIKPLRIGERKINSLFIDNEECIKEYFEPPYFINLLNSINKFEDSPELVVHNALDTLKIGNKSVNINRHISKGILSTPKISNKSVTRLVLDIDCYSTEDSYILNIFDSGSIEEILENLNDLSFNIYKNTLTEKFINILTGKEKIPHVFIEGIKIQESGYNV